MTLQAKALAKEILRNLFKKKQRARIIAGGLLGGFALSVSGVAQEGVWQINCTGATQECRSVWITVTLPGSAAGILLAYDAIRNKKGGFDASVTVNLNGIVLAPEQNAVSLSGNEESVSIPIVAKDDSGVTAQFTNLNTVNQIVTTLTNSDILHISFMALNASAVTTVTIPMNHFNELLTRVPHGDVLFTVGRE